MFELIKFLKHGYLIASHEIIFSDIFMLRDIFDHKIDSDQ